MVAEIFDSIDGIKCNKVMGAMYAFPQIQIPKRAVEKAKVGCSLYMSLSKYCYKLSNSFILYNLF